MKLYHLIYEQTDKRKVSLAVLTYQGKVLIVKRFTQDLFFKTL